MAFNALVLLLPLPLADYKWLEFFAIVDVKALQFFRTYHIKCTLHIDESVLIWTQQIPTSRYKPPICNVSDACIVEP